MAFKLSPNVLAIFLMIMSVGAASGLDSVVKFVANEGMHPIQISKLIWIGGAFTTIPEIGVLPTPYQPIEFSYSEGGHSFYMYDFLVYSDYTHPFG